MDFLGIKNVIDAKAILGKDGMTDGFNVRYFVERKYANGKIKRVEKRDTVWVREFDPSSVGNDGSIRGVGGSRICKGKTSKTKLNLSVIQKILSK